MVRRARVTFLMRDLDRLKYVQGVVDGQLRLYQAAERLGLTTRQLRPREWSRSPRACTARPARVASAG